MKLCRSHKAKIGILLIILSALMSNLFMSWKEIEQFRNSPKEDDITAYEKRFKNIKTLLPPQGVVGYITDLTDQSAQWYKEYFLTQYVLSPVIVTNETSRHLVIGNFHKPINWHRLFSDTHLVLLREFGGGVILFRNTNLN